MKAKKDKSIQTPPWKSHRKVISRGIPVSLTAPEHFSAEQINKLESRFSHQKWPDKTDIIIIGMESNLLAEEVEVPYTLWIFPEISGLSSVFLRVIYKLKIVKFFAVQCEKKPDHIKQ